MSLTEKASIALPIIFLLALAFLAAAVAFLVFPLQPPFSPAGQITGTPTVNITIYGGEISYNTFGFGMSPSNLSSPGPFLTFKTTDIVNLTFVNSGQIPHAFAVTDAPKSTANVLFHATVASAANPLASNQTGSVVFQPNVAGNYYYICPLPSHAENYGMWGELTVT